MDKIKKEHIVRFWSRVKKTQGCWTWTGGKHRQGYGFFYFDSGSELAHRVSYLIEFKKFPKNKFVCHHCDNPSCVRPSHLFLGTQKDNIRDMVRKGRAADMVGEKNSNSILTYKKVIELKNLLKSKKFTYKELAKKFGISYGEVNNIVSGYCWKNVKQ